MLPIQKNGPEPGATPTSGPGQQKEGTLPMTESDSTTAETRGPRPTGFYDRAARAVWPDADIGLHLIHVIRVRSVHLGTPTYPKCMTAAEESAVRRELARAEAEA